MLPFESHSVRIAEDKFAYILLYDFTHQWRLPEVSEIKNFAESVARNLQFNELTIRCDFIGHEWRFNFIFLPVGMEQRINIPYSIASPQLYRLNPDRIASNVSDYILATVRGFTQQQTWQIQKRLKIGRLISEYRYDIRVCNGQEQCRFEAKSVAVNITEPCFIGVDGADAENPASFTFTQTQWLEIEAEVHNRQCELVNHQIVFNNFPLDAHVLGHFDYFETVEFRIKPNIVAGSLLISGDRITFETLPVHGRRAPRDFSVNHHPFVEVALRENYRRFADSFHRAPIEKPAIYNQTCKYFNGGDYLQCAVNPEGACDRCNDFEAKRQ